MSQNTYLEVPEAHQKKGRIVASGIQSEMFPIDVSKINLHLKETKVEWINFVTARPIIEAYEWIGTMPLPKSCRFISGIYFDYLGNPVLGGTEVFVEPSTRMFNEDHPRQAVQLNRGACLPWTPRNTASYMLGQSLQMLKREGVKIVIAYCTQEAGEIGNIYQACSWDFVGLTQPSKTYWLDEHWVSERTLADKKKWAREKNNPDWIAKFENLPMRKLKPKLRYVKILAKKKERAAIRERYNFDPLPYPKRLQGDG